MRPDEPGSASNQNCGGFSVVNAVNDGRTRGVFVCFHQGFHGILDWPHLREEALQLARVQAVVGPLGRQNDVLFRQRKIAPFKCGVHVLLVQGKDLVVANNARIGEIQRATVAIFHEL